MNQTKKSKLQTEVLGTTVSLCPDCLGRIPAHYVAREDEVFLEKTCPEHGDVSTLVWSGVDNFIQWCGGKVEAEIPGNGNCPSDCGLCSSHKQSTCCVLLEITERCNLRCPVCFASSGGDAARKDPALSEIEEWYDYLMEQGGPFNIQLSGGEPTMRDDLPAIIQLGKEKGFTFFQINTNGVRLADEYDYVLALAKAGLNTAFLQFDSLDAQNTETLRGKDLVAIKKKAIDHCGRAGIGVVLVPTIAKGCNDGEIGDILAFAAQNMPAVRGVHFQPMSFFGRYDQAPENNKRFIIPHLLQAIEQQTGGQLQAADFKPGNTEHPLCSFHANYHVIGGKWKVQNTASSGCCEPVSSQQARKAVALKWSASQQPAAPTLSLDKTSKYDLSSLDDFLQQRKEQSLAISGMAFQDVWNLDLERLQRCYIHEVGRDRRLIPFCSYNLTDRYGNTLYRGKDYPK